MMANGHETTFGNLEVDERFKKLQRSLKLSVLKQEHGKSAHGKAFNMSIPSNISSITVDTLDSSSMIPPSQASSIKSGVLAASIDLRNIMSRKRSRNTEQGTMTTSSVKQYNQLMPPPVGSTVYRAARKPQDRDHTLLDCEKAVSLNTSVKSSTVSLNSASSWISTNTDANKEYLNTFVTPTPTDNHQKIGRVFLKWRVTLNQQCELIIKGTLECGSVARSKPVVRRYSATCVESKYKYKYILQGNIFDERNGLPDYVRGKFYNGFPDDWENVYQIWRTYVSQGCPVTFRWPTPITDSDDDLKSEITDLTYTRARNKKIISTNCNLNKYTNTDRLNDTPEEKKKHDNSTRSFQNSEKNTSMYKYTKSFISNSEKDIIPVIQMRNTESLRDDTEQSVKSDINPACGSKKVNKLKDILQEDKLKIIINNLTDKNCSPKYIHKIIEMFDCLDYVVSYRTELESNNDSVVSTSNKTFKSETIPPQQNLVCNDNSASSNRLRNKPTKSKSCTIVHSDMEYERNGRNNSNANQLSHSANMKPESDKDSDKSESETYAGVRKISIEQFLKARESSRKLYNRKVRKKTNHPSIQKHTANLPYNAEEIESESARMANPIANAKKNLLLDESGISITEDEVERMSNTRCHKTIDITQRPQKMTFSNPREVQRNNFDVYGKGKSATHVQNQQLLDAFEAQRVNLNVLTKEQKFPCRVEKNAHSSFVADIDYTINSDVDVVTISSSARTTDRNMIASQAKVNQNIEVISENNSDFPEKPCAAPNLHREFIKQTESEIAKKSKPTIISSMPINLKITAVDPKTGKLNNSKIFMKNVDKQDINVQSLKVTDNKSTSKTSIATKPVVNDSCSKTTIDDKREVCPMTNNKNESDNINPTKPTTNSTTEQLKSSKLGTEQNPKVLTMWLPKVIYYAKSKSELGLTFEGKLLNEAGHVVYRKFKTDIVLKRLSATLIETVNHEFYELLGHLNDNKHIIPKELAKQCRYGCPAKIEQFCLTWKTLQHDNVRAVGERVNDTTIDTLNPVVSSRGRHVVPPLSYWMGERIALKDNNPVYSPGTSQESLLSLTDNSKEKIIQKNVDSDERAKQKVNSKKNISKKQSVNTQTLSESNKISGTNKNQTVIIEKSQNSKRSPKVGAANGARKSDNLKKSISSKRQLARELTFSSTEFSEEEQEESPRKQAHNSRTNGNANPNYYDSRYTMTLRKRQKVKTSRASSTESSEESEQEESPRKQAHNSRTNGNANPNYYDSRYTMTLRQRQKVKTSRASSTESTESSEESEQEESPRKRARNSQTNGNADPNYYDSRYTMSLRKRRKDKNRYKYKT